MTQQQQPTVVAIDLGSNSFHLLEATADQDHRLRPLTALARKVQLALDMDAGGMAPAAIERGLECLREFASYCRQLPPERVRVVGTQALRVAPNRDIFIKAAERILNHPIAIISGDEEARLAYLGVTADIGDDGERLVADIGGASTELVAGRDAEIHQLASLQLGCVSWLRFFPGGDISERALGEAIACAREAFDSASGRFAGNWSATGCSGTLLAVGAVLQNQGWSDGAITRQGLERMLEALLQFERIAEVHFQGLSEDRRGIFASGTAIVLALFQSLHIERMELSSYGLREGVARELLQGFPGA